MIRVYKVLCYAHYSETTIESLFVEAKNKKTAYNIALKYIADYNKRCGFEYYTEFLERAGRKTPKGGIIYDGKLGPVISQLKTIN